MEYRFNEICDHKHTEKNNSTDQYEINRAEASVSIKLENQINMFKEEMDNMQHITSLTKETTEHSEANKEIEIIKELVSDKTQEKEYFGKELENVDEEVSNKEEAWLHCVICVYKCKTEKTIPNFQLTLPMHISLRKCGVRQLDMYGREWKLW